MRFLKRTWKTIYTALFLPSVIRLIVFLTWALMKTCRIELHGIEQLLPLAKQAQQGKCRLILALWHNRIFMLLPVLRQNHYGEIEYTAMISKSSDGDLPASLSKIYPPFRSIRVPHNAKHQAALEMIEELEKGRVLIITPDGPKGPKERVKMGIVYAAQKAQATILPFSWSASKCWRLNTWDGFMIPKPFSTIKVVYGRPLSMQEDEEEEAFQKRAEKALKQLDI